MPEEDAVDAASQYACDRILEGIKDDLAYFGVIYDNYFRERALHESGAITATLDALRKSDKAEEHEGALWFSMDEQQDEKDRVLVRATGEPTYFAADAAYHQDKLRRGYDFSWTSGFRPSRLRSTGTGSSGGFGTFTGRLASLARAVREPRQGRPEGIHVNEIREFITLREVLDEVGPDAARFFFLTKRSDSHLDFDLDLAKKQSRENPVYYVQYMHARIASIFRIASERNIETDMERIRT